MSDTTTDPQHSFGNFLGTRRRELTAVLVVFLLGLFLRVQYAPNGSFDREFDGFQAGFFSFTAINYERMGFEATGAYPVVNLDLDTSDPDSWYVYRNHSPALPLLSWASLKCFGPDGWETAWESGRSPSGLGTDHQFEFAIRLPMYILSLLGLVAFWWAVRIEGGPRAALLSMLLYAAAPLAVLDAGLVNYEPGSILSVVLCYGFFAKMRVADRLGESPKIWTRQLLFTCLLIAMGSAQTFGPMFFALPLCVAALISRHKTHGLPAGIMTACAIGLAALVPILVHSAWSDAALRDIEPGSLLSDRIKLLFEPLTSGSVPLGAWLMLQYEHLVTYASEGLVDFAFIGLVFAGFILAGRAESKSTAPNPVVLPLLLLVGGTAFLFGFYKHTADDPAQSPFMLAMLPALAALAGLAFCQIGDAVGRVFARGGRPHGGAILTGALLLMTLVGARQTTSHLWAIWRGPLPELTMPEVAGSHVAKLLPPGAIGMYPAALGLNIATSFYAWRTLLPITSDPASFQAVENSLDALGKLDSPRYVLLPEHPPATAQADIDAIEAIFQKMAPEVAAREPQRSGGWRAWCLTD